MIKEALIHIHTGLEPQSNAAGGDLAGHLGWPPLWWCSIPLSLGLGSLHLPNFPKASLQQPRHLETGDLATGDLVMVNFKQSPNDLIAPVHSEPLFFPRRSHASGFQRASPPLMSHRLISFLPRVISGWHETLLNHRNANTVLPLFSPKRNKVFQQLIAIFLFSTHFSSFTLWESVPPLSLWILIIEYFDLSYWCWWNHLYIFLFPSEFMSF